MKARNSLKQPSIIKNEPVASNHENQDDIIDNLLRDEGKNLKSNQLNFEKFKTDKPSCSCNLCDLDLDYM